jgi:hypothetical protein
MVTVLRFATLDRVGPRQQLERDQQEQQASRGLQRRDGHPQVGQHLLTDEREHDDHQPGGHHREHGRPVARALIESTGHREEDGHVADRIHDDEHRHDHFGEQHRIHPRSLGPVGRPTRATTQERRRGHANHDTETVLVSPSWRSG